MRFLLILLLSLSGVALADERFDKLDYDGDGKISKAEAAGNADLIKGFDKHDRNKDGKLSKAEYDRLTRPKTAAGEPKSGTGSTSPRRGSR